MSVGGELANETIKDFLVSIGFTVRDDEYRRFENSIEKATLRAKLLGDAIEDMVRRVLSAVANTADAFDRMYFSAQRNLVAVETMKSLGYAASQAGSSIGEAIAALETMARKIR